MANQYSNDGSFMAQFLQGAGTGAADQSADPSQQNVAASAAGASQQQQQGYGQEKGYDQQAYYQAQQQYYAQYGQGMSQRKQQLCSSSVGLHLFLSLTRLCTTTQMPNEATTTKAMVSREWVAMTPVVMDRHRP